MSDESWLKGAISGIIMASVVWVFVMINFTRSNNELVKNGCMEYNTTTGKIQFLKRVGDE